MGAGPSFVFLPFRLDLTNECLWCGQERRALRSKTFAVFRQLLEQPGQLVTKEALLETVWPDAYVSDAALTVCIREIRQALGDDPKTPRFIETVHRRGYRFIGDLSQPVAAEPTPTPVPPPAPTVVGRTNELEQLHAWWTHAQHGTRQIGFIDGEPGIGKTTLVETFLGQLAGEELWIGRGQCVDHYGVGEAYLPVLEALGRLCREVHGDTVIGLLRQHAPTWLVQMPALLGGEEHDQLQLQVQGATQDRMLRELAEALEALTRERPFILWLEDLHWSDHATVALLSALARRTEPARLLILGTYRPADVLVRDHPLTGLKQELAFHDQCQELSPEYLSEAAIGEYVSHRFGLELQPTDPWSAFVQAIHQRTGGNPLFMMKVVEDVQAREVISQTAQGWTLQYGFNEDTLSIPTTVRQLIDQQFERVSDTERTVLEAASVAGAEFSAAAVAVAVNVKQEAVERCCDGLARRAQFLRDHGAVEWPDGTVAAQYGFIHALYHEVVYERLAVSRRARLHQVIGEREALGHGEQTAEIAAKLAVHFEQGRAYEQAVQYYEQAGQQAAQRSANYEALGHFTQALSLLKTSPGSPTRDQQELILQAALGPVLMAAKGYASSELESTYLRARDLCEQLGDQAQLFAVLLGLWRVYIAGPEKIHIARQLGERLLTSAQSQHDPQLLLEAHYAMGFTLYTLGEFSTSLEHSQRAIALYEPEQHRSHAILYGQDPGVVCRDMAAFALWRLGYPDQALQKSQEALALAQQLGHPFSLATAQFCTAILHQYRREERATQEHAAATIEISTSQGFEGSSAFGAVLHGWALTQQGRGEEGTAQIRHGLDAYRATGAELWQPYFLALLAEASTTAEQGEERLRLLSEALQIIDAKGEYEYEAELYRLKGDFRLQQSQEHQSEAEACLHRALAVARRQQAKSLELRAAMSLARLWQQHGKKAEAHALLAPVYNWFTEGFDTADLQTAKALLAELA